jgi:alkyl sulfatase BDS1-like metallo-beta-lactamase superfamily hydrolase
MVIDNAVWPFTNTYTLRGDRFRDPRNWIAALRQIRDLQPEIILTVGAGGAPIIGRQACQDAVSALMDQMSFIYDQSLRLTSQGVNMNEIRHHIRLPDSLLASPYNNETYGQFDTFPQANPIYNHGWFSGYAEDMHSLPRAAKADYWLKLAGGADKVIAAYEKAMENAEYLWAKELAAQLYYADPANEAYRQALADVFRRLGQMSPGSIARNFYLSAANSLEGNDVISIAGVQSAAWVAANPAQTVDFLRIRINPQLADGIEGVLLFDIDGNVSALHVRNSIAEFVPDPDTHYRQPDGHIKVSAEGFARYFRGEIGVDDLLDSATASGQAEELLDLFDPYQRTPLYPYARR